MKNVYTDLKVALLMTMLSDKANVHTWTYFRFIYFFLRFDRTLLSFISLYNKVFCRGGLRNISLDNNTTNRCLGGTFPKLSTVSIEEYRRNFDEFLNVSKIYPCMDYQKRMYNKAHENAKENVSADIITL